MRAASSYSRTLAICCAACSDVSAVVSAVRMYSWNASDFQRPSEFLDMPVRVRGWLAAARADSPPIHSVWLESRAGGSNSSHPLGGALESTIILANRS